MKANMSNTDRTILVVAAVLAAVLYLTGTIAGTPGIILIVVAAIFLLTSFTSFCPLYKLPGISTNKK